jgi:hypothetical protein
MLCLISYILALTIKDDAIEVDGFTHTERFFTSS